MSETVQNAVARGPQSRGRRRPWPTRRRVGGLGLCLVARLRPPALPDGLGTAILLGSVVPLDLGAKALQLGHGRVALVVGVPGLLAFAIGLAGAGAPDPLDEIGKGEIEKLSHEQFERLVERVELLGAATPVPPDDEGDHFEQLVRAALDELPDFLQASLADNVAVLICDDEDERGYYGLYHGGTVVYGRCHSNRIVIYRDTLLRDFGHDPDHLRREVAITVRHEVAHHLGAGEREVAQLGL